MGRDVKGARRAGAVAPLTCLLLVPVLIGMLAFSIDVGYMVQVRTELQNTADAAALAGAQALMGAGPVSNVANQNDGIVKWNQAKFNQTGAQRNTIRTNAINNAKTAAKAYGANNLAGDKNITINDADVEVGYLDQNDSYSSSPGSSTFPNSVRVTARRDSSANTPLKLFFGALLGTSEVPLTATARATLYTGDIQTFSASYNVRGSMLPVALDVFRWNEYVSSGKSLDQDSNAGTSQWSLTTTNGPDGNPQLKVYPVKNQAPGNFSLLDIGPPENNAPAFRTWIDEGQSPADVSYLLDNNLLPVSPTSPKDWKGGPGLKSTLEPNFDAQMGQPNLIPLFLPVKSIDYPASDPRHVSTTADYQAASGTGQNASYAIIGFVGVTITTSDGSGSSLDIAVQPFAVTDPTVPPAGSTSSSGYVRVVPAGETASGGTISNTNTYLPPRLTE